MNNFSNVSARVFNTPLVVHQAKAEAWITGVGPLLSGQKVEFQSAEFADAGDVALRQAAASMDPRQPYAGVLDDDLANDIRAGRIDGYHMLGNTAIIPVTGTLIHRGSWVGKSSGQRSYEGLLAQIEAVRADDYVRKCALEVDSFGGEVAGCAAVAAAIRKLAEEKETWAFVADHAYSAGYWLASQASRVIVSKTGGTGSIGVIWFHVDRSEAAQQMGIKVTPLHSGAFKADGHPYAPLEDDVAERIGAELRAIHEVFADDVGSGRGVKLDKDAALATEAATFVGAAAIDAGLADAAGDLRDEFRGFALDDQGRPRSSATLAQRGNDMSNTPDPKGRDTAAEHQDAAEDVETDQVDDDQVEDDATDDDGGAGAAAAGKDGGADVPTDPAAAAKARAKAILDCDEAKGRESLAKALAFDDAYAGLDLSAAKQLLSTSPRGTATGRLAEDMDGDDSDLGNGAASGSGNDANASMIAVTKARHGIKDAAV